MNKINAQTDRIAPFDDKQCYQCGTIIPYLFEDSRCSKCTRLTPEEVMGEVAWDPWAKEAAQALEDWQWMVPEED